MATPPKHSNHQGAPASQPRKGSLRDRAIAGSIQRKQKKTSRQKKAKNPWEFETTNSAQKSFSLKTIATSALLLILLTLGIYLGITSQLTPTDPSPSAPTKVNNHSSANLTPVFSQPPLEIAHRFLATSDPQERLNWALNPQQTSQKLKLYPEEALSHTVKKIDPLPFASNGNLLFARFVAIFPNGNRRLLCVLPTPNGSKIDWDAFARYGTASWNDILNGTATHALVRAFITPAHHYSHHFHDDSQWACFQLTSPDMERPILAYANRNEKSGQLLTQALSNRKNRKKQKRRITLSIRSTPENLVQRQFTIERIHCFGWVQHDQDIEDSWQPPLLKPK